MVVVVERKNIFDVKNRILEENIYYYLAKDSVKYKFEYNDLNKITRQYIYKPNGSIKDEWVFNYDAHGNRIETIYNGYITTSFKYDGKRNLIETSSFNGKVESYKYSSFDINGNWQQQTIFKNTIPIKIVSREYKYY